MVVKTRPYELDKICGVLLGELLDKAAYLELRPAFMDIERLRLAKGNDPGIQTMHQRAERKKVKFAIIFANS
jgi:hypothetical protein